MTYVHEPSAHRRVVWRRIMDRSRRIQKRIWQPIRNPLRKSTACFVVGCGRSGTDLLAEHIDRSPLVRLFNETDPRAFVNWRLRELDTVRSLTSESFARVVLYKPITESHRAAEFLALGDDSRILIAFRHYSDTVNSMVRFFGDSMRNTISGWRDARPDVVHPVNATPATRAMFRGCVGAALSLEDFAALIWCVRNHGLLELGLGDDERVEMSEYGRLVEQPAVEFARICRFLGVGFRRSMTEGVFGTSVSKAAPPELAPSILQLCEQIWERLLEAYRIRAVRAGVALDSA